MKIPLFLPLATGQSLDPLPTVDDIERELISLLIFANGAESYDPNILLHQYTCLAQGSTRDTYVSIIATFTPNSGQPQQTQHFQLTYSSGI